MPAGSTELFYLRNKVSNDFNEHLALENTVISLRSFDLSGLET